MCWKLVSHIRLYMSRPDTNDRRLESIENATIGTINERDSLPSALPLSVESAISSSSKIGLEECNCERFVCGPLRVLSFLLCCRSRKVPVELLSMICPSLLVLTWKKVCWRKIPEMVESSALFLHLSLSDSELYSGDSDLDWIPGTFLFFFLLKSSIGERYVILDQRLWKKAKTKREKNS